MLKLAIFIVILLLATASKGGHVRVYCYKADMSKRTRTSCQAKVDKLTDFRMSEIIHKKKPRWMEWLELTGSDIPETFSLVIRLVRHFKSGRVRTILFNHQQALSFSGCSTQRKSYSTDKKNYKFHYTIEYIPQDLCLTDEHQCDTSTTTCECQGNKKYRCNCLNGYSESKENNYMCILTNRCQEANGGCNSTSSTCERTGRGTRDCVCKPGFQRFSDTDCVAINHCNDSKSICGQFATCTFEGPGMYHCHCKEGFNAIAPSSQAPNCRPINLCQNETNPCNDTSQCFFTGPALYFCEPCPNSVKINENSTCEILNPCHSGAVTCGINATCQHTGGENYACRCDDGYEQENATSSCTPINKCASRPCGVNSNCINTGPGTYTCKCMDGFESMFSNERDCTPINLCKHNNGNCQENSECIFKGPKVRNCSCLPGFHETEDGICEEIDPCLTKNGGCGNVTTTMCNHTGPNSRECACFKNYTSTNNQDCYPINPCLNENYGGCNLTTEWCKWHGPNMSFCNCLYETDADGRCKTCSESTTCIDDDDFDYDIDYDENDNGNDGNVTDTNRNHDAINEEEVINQKESEQTSSDIFNTLTTFENMTRSTVEYIEGNNSSTGNKHASTTIGGIVAACALTVVIVTILVIVYRRKRLLQIKDRTCDTMSKSNPIFQCQDSDEQNSKYNRAFTNSLYAESDQFLHDSRFREHSGEQIMYADIDDSDKIQGDGSQDDTYREYMIPLSPENNHLIYDLSVDNQPSLNSSKDVRLSLSMASQSYGVISRNFAAYGNSSKTCTGVETDDASYSVPRVYPRDPSHTYQTLHSISCDSRETSRNMVETLNSYDKPKPYLPSPEYGMISDLKLEASDWYDVPNSKKLENIPPDKDV